MAYALLLFIPLSLALRYIFDAPHSWVFLTGAAAIAVLADWLRRATDQLAERAGSTIGGLLNISFGNTAELILALFVLSRAHIRIVQAQITGLIIGTTLLFSRHLETAATLTGGAAIRDCYAGGTGTQRATVTEFAMLNDCGRHRLANSSPYPILIE